MKYDIIAPIPNYLNPAPPYKQGKARVLVQETGYKGLVNMTLPLLLA